MTATEIHWVDVRRGRLGIMARPRGNDGLPAEVRAWAVLNAHTVVSLLETAEADALGLQDEQVLCALCGIEFVRFPVPDHRVPEAPDRFFALAEELATLVAGGKTVLIHCRAGIGRSALLAAAIIVRNGCSADEAFDALSRARGVVVPETLEQENWFHEHLDRAAATPAARPGPIQDLPPDP